MITKITLLFLFLLSIECIFDIEQYGAIANSDTLASQFKNKQAIEAAITAANNS